MHRPSVTSDKLDPIGAWYGMVVQWAAAEASPGGTLDAWYGMVWYGMTQSAAAQTAAVAEPVAEPSPGGTLDTWYGMVWHGMTQSPLSSGQS